MTPPGADVAGNTANATATPAVSSCLSVLQNRADFLAAARARRAAFPGFVIQGRSRQDGSDTIRVGFTCSKKVGNAVARNHAKRRLREIARLILPDHGKTGWDYVLIGRAEVTASRDFQVMQKDLIAALQKLHGK